jgi:hypothetical protein
MRTEPLRPVVWRVNHKFDVVTSVQRLRIANCTREPLVAPLACSQAFRRQRSLPMAIGSRSRQRQPSEHSRGSVWRYKIT